STPCREALDEPRHPVAVSPGLLRPEHGARAETEKKTAPLGLAALARQEFLVAIGNPKAILIFTAFLPQFVDPAAPVPGQFLVLGALFLLLEWIAISAYACMGLHMRRWFAEPRGKKIFNRCCAALLSAAASVLLLARRA
ncbi:LysE family translocator, partial [Pseudomonas sp. GW456-L14]